MALCAYNTEINNHGSEFVKHQDNKEAIHSLVFVPLGWGQWLQEQVSKKPGWSGARGEESVPEGERAIGVARLLQRCGSADTDLCQPLRSQLCSCSRAEWKDPLMGVSSWLSLNKLLWQ